MNEYTLRPYDNVKVRPDPFFKKHKEVILHGEVLYPGRYTILRADETITDIIKRANGLTLSAYPTASKYFRNKKDIKVDFDAILKNPKSNLNFEVQDGDSISILSHPSVVVINGEVNTSGRHKYNPNKKIKHYLKSVGGFTPDADYNNIWIEYPNGQSKKYNKNNIFGGPLVLDGSIIIIGKKEKKEDLNITELAKEVTSIIANVVQAIAILFLAKS